MLTKEQLMAAPFDSGWSDGREGYLWIRFDAVVDRQRLLRAEITWRDDAEIRQDGDWGYCYDPTLHLELNRLEENGERWVTVESAYVDLTDDKALRLIAMSPSRLLELYADEFAQLGKKK